MSRRRTRRERKSDALLVLLLVLVVGGLLLQCAARREPPRPASTPLHVLEGVRETPSSTRGELVGPLDSSPHVVLGVPSDSDPSDDVLLDQHEYVASYNPRRLNPNWVAWRLDRSYLGHVRRRDNFRSDNSLPVNVFRVTPNDYLHSGYDRGHLCPSADREASPEMNSVTFLMTNMVPQLHELNAGPWAKFEEHERDLAEAPGAEVYIVAGPVFDLNPPKIGHGIAVPTATWKVILALKSGQTADDVTDATEVISVIMPNEAGVGQHPWTEFVTSVDEVEKETGYDVLAKIPDEVEQVIESRRSSDSSARLR